MKIIISILIVLIFYMSIGIDHYQKQNIKLNRKISKLKYNNHKLIKKQKIIKQNIKKQREIFTKKFIKRAKLKLASIPAKVVPFMGITTIIAMTSSDINSYCEDIKQMKEFEKDLFGNTSNLNLNSEEQLCGMDIEKELIPMIKEQLNKSTF